MNRNDIFPSKYLKAGDIGDREVPMTISHVTLEELGMEREERCVVYFKGTSKALVLNSTNYNTIAAVLGSDETDDWTGRDITLRTELVSFRGTTNPALRVKPAVAQAVKKPLRVNIGGGGSLEDDVVPFAACWQ
jgi:hypothetical protein